MIRFTAARQTGSAPPSTDSRARLPCLASVNRSGKHPFGARQRSGQGRSLLPHGLITIGLAMLAVACAPQAGRTPTSETPAASAAEMSYLELHKAIAAYTRCRDVEFTPQQHQALETRVQRMVGEPLGASTMLSLIEQARIDMAARIATQSCRSETIAPYVTRFETDLAPAVRG